VNLDESSRTSLHQAPFEPLRRGEFVAADDDQGVAERRAHSGASGAVR
jgi:hypothetical protein